MPGISHGADARRIASDAADHVEYLSRTASELHVADPVGRRFADVVGHGNELHDAAESWRQVADRVEKAAGDVGARLGGIDQAWQGADADAFLAHMQKAGLAGNDIVDSMRALSAALDHTAETIRSLVADLGELIADGADAVSGAMIAADGERRARELLAGMDQPARELFESVEDVVRAFARFCAGFESGGAAEDFRLEHRMPEQDWDSTAPAAASASPGAPPAEGAGGSAPAAASGAAGSGSGSGTGAAAAGSSGAAAPDLAEGGRTEAAEPSETPPAAAAAAAGAGTVAAGGMVGGMMPMGGMMGGMGAGQGQGAQQRQNSSRTRTDSEDLFGAPQPPAPAVFGEDRKPEETKTDAPSTSPQGEEKPKRVADGGLLG